MVNYDKSSISVNRDVELLAPFVRERAVHALAECRDAGYPMAIFEGFRNPVRQDFLYAQGRTESGKIVTEKKGWESTHPYGVAFDVAYYINGRWSWDGDFDKPAQFFIKAGFEWLSPYEKAHFQITGGISAEAMFQITRELGVQTLWQRIAAKL